MDRSIHRRWLVGAVAALLFATASSADTSMSPTSRRDGADEWELQCAARFSSATKLLRELSVDAGVDHYHYSDGPRSVASKGWVVGLEDDRLSAYVAYRSPPLSKGKTAWEKRHVSDEDRWEIERGSFDGRVSLGRQSDSKRELERRDQIRRIVQSAIDDCITLGKDLPH
jgi:hypothetical protein